MLNTIITGSGAYIPEKIINNDFFLNHEFFDENGSRISKPNQETIDKFVDITEIESRRYLDDSLLNSDMATMAAKESITNANINPEELDYIIVAHNYGDISLDNMQVDVMPSMSARVKHKLGIKNPLCKTYDMNFGCPGWIEGVILGHQLIQAKIAHKILVVGSETLSRVTDPHDRSAMIFADGAGAVVLEGQESNQKIGIITHATLSHNGDEMSYLANGPSLNKDYQGPKISIGMRGRKVYEYALTNVPKLMKSVIDSAGLHVTDLQKVLLHQANAKMDHAMAARLFKLYKINDYNPDVAPMTVQFLGNTSVATVPIMFHLINSKTLGNHQFNANDKIIMASVGAGMNINALIYQFPS